MGTQETLKPAGKTTAQKKGAKLPLKAHVLTRRFSVERPHETALAIAIVSEAIREQMRGFVEENGGRKACCHRISIQEDFIVYELRDVQNCPQCAFKPLNPPTKNIPALSTIPPDAA